MNIKPPPVNFQTVFSYNYENGTLTRLSTGKLVGVRYKTNKAYKDYGYIKHAGKDYAVHRVVWAVIHGEWPATGLDHIDHNKRNNRIENLRLATPSENQRNLSRYKNNTTGHSGITISATGKFVVRLGYNGKRRCLGTYDTIEQAIAVRNAVMEALEFHPNHGV